MIEDYKKALHRGEKDCKQALARGRHPHPPALEELVPTVGTFSQQRLGVMPIPLGMVVGTRTAARQEAFSRTFMPLLGPRTEFATKWSHLLDAQEEEGFRDPVKVYEYLHRFYVEEGNKRVSVLKYLGSPSIEAEVIRVLPPEAPPDDAARESEVDLYHEFLAFWRVAPLYDIEFTRAGSYGRLATYLGQDLRAPWPDDAVRRLKSVYLVFRAAYLRAGGDHLDISCGDALLIYMDVYGAQGLVETPADVLHERILRLWAELATSSAATSPVLVDEPEVARPTALALVASALPLTRKKPLVAAFAYDGNVATSYWARAHDNGRKTLDDSFGGLVRTIAFEDCGREGGLAAAIESAGTQGATVFFSCSPALMDETVKAAAEHPDMRFLNCSVNLPHGLVRSYYGRMHEAKFVAGAVAGALASNHLVAYRASLPLFGSIAEINAFAEGVALVDPRARVVLDWVERGSGSGIDNLTGRGITTISGADITIPYDDPRAHGLYQVVGGSVVNLASPFWDWGRYYRLIVSSLLQGELPGTAGAGGDSRTPRAVTYWYGMSSGVIDLFLSDGLPSGVRKLANLLKHDIVAGAVSPFDGELADQGGTVRHSGEGHLSSAEVVSMDWLAHNVEGEIAPEVRAGLAGRKSAPAKGLPETPAVAERDS